ncbi:hypothetical protein QBC41DRAFT_279849 [Cercophora samala]|uniref:NWD NACHT-NTPase N-terminal domain-containing protein n=1 Tax=Cercophora samala TaxID=330535 RepID=A0AA40DB15_9PEZI|nr:hypothetical protein QBC41DRAFT_279849 [Cercophora samala]
MGCCCSSPKTADSRESHVVEQLVETAIVKSSPIHPTPTPTTTDENLPVTEQSLETGKLQSLSTPTKPIPTPAPANTVPSIPSSAEVSSHVPRPLWDAAYDKVQSENLKLVQRFETILLRVDFDSDYLDLKEEEQYRNCTERNQRLAVAVECGLKKTEQWAKAMETTKDVTEVLTYVGGIIQSTLQAAVPQAGAAWLGVSILLKGFSNAAQQSIDNRAGILYVGSRISWYQELLSIRRTLITSNIEGLRLRLEKSMIDLFAKIIAYQMRSVCDYYTNQLKVTLSNSVSMSTWEDELNNIKDSEQEVCLCLEQYDRKAGLDLLTELTMTAGKLEAGMQAQLEEISKRKAGRADKLVGKFSVSGLNYEEFMDRNPRPTDGTCQWFFKDERVHNWEEGPERLLLITAMPGQGKSVLARSLVHQWREDRQRRNIVCHFFFKDTNDTQKSVTMALCAVLHQILRQDRLLALKVENIINQEGEALTGSLTRLWSLLEEVTLHVSPERAPIICVLDALDECRQTELKYLLGKITTFCNAENHKDTVKPKLKFLLTTRPIESIIRQLKEVPKISLDPRENAQVLSSEIELVIQKKVDDMAPSKDWSDDLRARIKKAFMKKGIQLTYLWLRLVFELLEEEWALPEEEWILRITELPPTVNDAYEKLLSKVNPGMKSYVKELLSIMLCEKRPLELEELNVALRAAVIQPRPVDRTHMPDVSGLKTWINSHCGFFVQIYRDKLQFIHQTAKEFLTSPLEGGCKQMTEWQGSFELETAHQRMRDLCCRYLADRTKYWKSKEWDGSEESAAWPLYRPKPLSLHSLDRFMAYAISHRQYHNNRSGAAKDLQLVQHIVADCDSPIASVHTPERSGLRHFFQKSGQGIYGHVYAHWCLEILKKPYARKGMDQVEHLVPVRQSPRLTTGSKFGKRLPELEEKTERFIRGLIYPDGDSTKKPKIQVARIYLAFLDGLTLRVISEHIEGQSLESISNSSSDETRNACYRQLSKMLLLFACLPSPHNTCSSDDGDPRFNKLGRPRQQVEMVLRETMFQSCSLKQLSKKVPKVHRSKGSRQTEYYLSLSEIYRDHFIFSSDGTVTLIPQIFSSLAFHHTDDVQNSLQGAWSNLGGFGFDLERELNSRFEEGEAVEQLCIY